MATAINLQQEVDKILVEYNAKVSKLANEEITDVAKEATKKLRQTSPKKTGKYAKGWTYQVEKGRISNEATVYGKKDTYPLAHLLEFGHAKRNGGRVAGIEHIKPVADWAAEELERRIIRRLDT